MKRLGLLLAISCLSACAQFHRHPTESRPFKGMEVEEYGIGKYSVYFKASYYCDEGHYAHEYFVVDLSDLHIRVCTNQDMTLSVYGPQTADIYFLNDSPQGSFREAYKVKNAVLYVNNLDDVDLWKHWLGSNEP